MTVMVMVRWHNPKEVVMLKIAFCDARGSLNDLNEKLGGQEGYRWLGKLKRMLHEQEVLLQGVTAVTVNDVSKFVAADAFGSDNPDGIQFELWPKFKEFFLNKIEENIPASKLIVCRLIEATLDEQIVVELGDHAETTLAHLYELIKGQANGQAGPLHSSCMNIFYIRNIRGELWTVNVDWKSNRGWNVFADSIKYPNRWPVGTQIFSRAF